MKKIKINKKNLPKLLIVFISIILSIISLVLIMQMNILPFKYIALIILVLCIINVLGVVGLFKWKKVGKVISIVMYILIILITIASFKYAKSITDFFKNAFHIDTEITVYDVVVLDSSSYKEIDDLNNKDMGYLNIGDDISYLEDISKLIEANFVEKDFATLYESLNNNEIDSMIVNDAYLDIYSELNEDFDDNTRVIYSFDKEITKKSSEVEDKRTYNIFISGSDSRSNVISSTCRSDVNMIATINLDTHELLLTSIPRDYYVTLHGIGKKDKLTHAGIYGIEMSKTTLEDLFDIDIDYTVKVGFNSVIKVVDLIGGIDVYSDADLTIGKYHYVKGMNHMDGDMALTFARERHSYASGDRHRVENQQAVLEAIVNKASKDKSLLLQADELLVALSDLYVTDIPADLIKSVISEQIDDMPTWKIVKQSVDGDGIMTSCYSMPGYSLYAMVPNQSTVNAATAKINEVLGTTEEEN